MYIGLSMFAETQAEDNERWNSFVMYGAGMSAFSLSSQVGIGSGSECMADIPCISLIVCSNVGGVS